MEHEGKRNNDLSAVMVILGALKDVDEGKYLLCAAPINITGSEAAPVRAILIENEL